MPATRVFVQEADLRRWRAAAGLSGLRLHDFVRRMVGRGADTVLEEHGLESFPYPNGHQAARGRATSSANARPDR